MHCVYAYRPWMFLLLLKAWFWRQPVTIERFQNGARKSVMLSVHFFSLTEGPKRLQPKWEQGPVGRGKRTEGSAKPTRRHRKHIFSWSPCCVLWYSTTNPVVKDVAEEVWAGRCPRANDPFGHVHRKNPGAQSSPNFFGCVYQKITTRKAGDIFLMQVFCFSEEIA